MKRHYVQVLLLSLAIAISLMGCGNYSKEELKAQEAKAAKMAMDDISKHYNNVEIDKCEMKTYRGYMTNIFEGSFSCDEDSYSYFLVDSEQEKVYYGYTDRCYEIEDEIARQLDLNIEPNDYYGYKKFDSLYASLDLKRYIRGANSDGTDEVDDYTCSSYYSFVDFEDIEEAARAIIEGRSENKVNVSFCNKEDDFESLSELMELYPGIKNINNESYYGSFDDNEMQKSSARAYWDEGKLRYYRDCYEIVEDNGINIHYLKTKENINYNGELDVETYHMPEITYDKKSFTVYTDSPRYHLFAKSKDVFKSEKFVYDAYERSSYKPEDYEKEKLYIKFRDESELYLIAKDQWYSAKTFSGVQTIYYR